ncbi:MAG TPA: phage tail sheath C-terminal domain-containing protein [Candidatus Thermoplasmatota archaeon]|nr:phage tail sheath C-terminal domain-containing protein [Candidatus Thermoplasmatota archaeon]
MPAALTYPGVYIEEVPSPVHTIAGVSTATTAFLGYTAKGPTSRAKKVYNFSEFERAFGGLTDDSEVAYAVQQYFQNGGTEAWIVRVAAGAQRAAITLQSGAGDKVLRVTAKNEGAWGNSLRLDLDYSTKNPDSLFNLKATETRTQGGVTSTVRSEAHANLSMDPNSSTFVEAVVNDASDLIDVAVHADVAALATTTASFAGWSLSGDLKPLMDANGVFTPALDPQKRFVNIIVDGDGPYEVAVFDANAVPTKLADTPAVAANLGANPPVPGSPAKPGLASTFQAAVRALKPSKAAFSGFTAVPSDATASGAAGTFLLLTSGTKGLGASVRVSGASAGDAAKPFKLGLANNGRERDGAAHIRPAATGTLGGDLAALNLASPTLSTEKLTVTIALPTGDVGPTAIAPLGGNLTSLTVVAAKLQASIQALSATVGASAAFGKVAVEVVGTRLLAFLANDPATAITFADVSNAGDLATTLKLAAPPAVANVQEYQLGGPVLGAESESLQGSDGSPPGANDLRGNQAAGTGMWALEKVDIFNLLCIPKMAELDDANHAAVAAQAASYCEARRAFFIADPPHGTKEDLAKFQAWHGKGLLPKSANAAVYYPWVKVPDPLNKNRPTDFPASGTLAGLFARTDAGRGVWKAPAGTEATLANVQGLSYVMTDMENGAINQLGVNALRQFPVIGNVSWGARTLLGADEQASQWKYVPVRRIALFIEESLYRGTKWVVFEPNDEPLWSQIRLNVGSFMHDLFRKGAFQGKAPKDAYFVKCDGETTPQSDIDKGIVNILVGFSPLKPAEFVVIKISQIVKHDEA